MERRHLSGSLEVEPGKVSAVLQSGRSVIWLAQHSSPWEWPMSDTTKKGERGLAALTNPFPLIRGRDCLSTVVNQRPSASSPKNVPFSLLYID